MNSSDPNEIILNARFRILQELGRGGMGCTFLAEDLAQGNRRCVVKEFRPQVTDEVNRQKCRDLFFREAETLKQLEHPQIPRFIDQFEWDEQLYLVQEYIEGQTYLQAIESRGGQFSETEVRAWLNELLRVLDYLHKKKFYHQDISPDNIILRKYDRKPVLIDFGAVTEAMAFQGQSVLRKTSILKRGYSSPEQLRGTKISAKSDLYSLAVTAVVLLTGKDPDDLIDGDNQWQWHDFAHVSPELSGMLDKMLQEKPSDRYQSAADALAALPSPIPEPSRSRPNEAKPRITKPSLTTVSPAPSVSPPSIRSPKRLVVAALLGLVVLGSIGAIAFGKSGICKVLNSCPPSPSPQPTATSSIAPSPKPTATSSITPSPKPTATSSITPSPKPTATSSITPSPKPTATSPITPSPKLRPTKRPSLKPTYRPIPPPPKSPSPGGGWDSPKSTPSEPELVPLPSDGEQVSPPVSNGSRHW